MDIPEKLPSKLIHLQNFLEERARWFQCSNTENTPLLNQLESLLTNSPPAEPNSLEDAIHTIYSDLLTEIIPTPESEISPDLTSTSHSITSRRAENEY